MRKLGYQDYLAGRGEKKNTFPAIFLIVLISISVLIIGGLLIYQQTRKEAPVDMSGGEPVQSLYMLGEVKVYNTDTGKWEIQNDLFELKSGNRVLTGSTGFLILGFQKGNDLRIGPNSEVVCQGGSQGSCILSLREGRVFLETTYGQYRIETANGCIRAGKTRAMMEYDTDGNFNIYCFSGILHACSLNGETGEEVLTEGRKITINDKTESLVAEDFNGESLDDWTKWNLSFTMEDIKLGSIPPMKKLEPVKDRVSLEFKSRPEPVVFKENDKKSNSPKKSEIKKTPIKLPKVEKKVSYPRAMPRVVQKIEYAPKVYEENTYPTKKSADLFRGGGSAADSLKEGRKNNKEYYKNLTEKERIKRFNMGGFYYLSNEQRSDDKQTSVPGYDLDSPPVGPSEITIDEYNRGSRPTDPWDAFFYPGTINTR